MDRFICCKEPAEFEKTLKYYHDLIVYDIKTHKIINWYDMISVSSGLNSYIVTV